MGSMRKPRIVPLVAETEPRWCRFWAAYPNKSAKLDARAAWAALAPDDAMVDRILAALAWQVTRRQWTKDGGQFVPLPATWLRAQRWTDEGTRTGAPVSSVEWLDAIGYCFHAPKCTDSEECRRLRAAGK